MIICKIYQPSVFLDNKIALAQLERLAKWIAAMMD